MMEGVARTRARANHNLHLKSSSLYFLNDISNFNSTENLDSNVANWRDSYTFNPVILGRGHFSKVYKAKCSSTGKYVAIKVVRRRRLGVDKIDDIMKEIEMMTLLNKSLNSAFIQLLKHHTSSAEVAILMEFASGGSIYNVIRDSETGLPEIYTRIILSKLMSALHVMHGHNIVHLDIKADNVLLRHPYPSTDVALADFGLAKKLSKTKVHKEMIGTPDYIAPEVSNYDSISTKSDMWSVGVLTYFILTNISPFCDDTKEQTLSRVTRAEYEFHGHLEDESHHIARDFISSLLIKMPEKRLSAEECLNHVFLSPVSQVDCVPPIVQMSEPSTSSTVNIPVHEETQLQIRDNINYKIRALVTSQYDFESLYIDPHLHDPKRVLLDLESNNHFPDNLSDLKLYEEKKDFAQRKEQVKQDIPESVDVKDDIVKENQERGSSSHEDDHTDSIISDIISDRPRHSDPNKDPHNCAEVYEVAVETKRNSNTSCIESMKLSDTSVSEITSSWNDVTTNVDISSGSVSINHEPAPTVPELNTCHPKESFKVSNQIQITKLHKNHKMSTSTNSISRTKFYDSRRRIKESLENSQLKSDSFRYSRDNLLNEDYTVKYFNEEISSDFNFDFDDSKSRDYSTIPLRSNTYRVKRRPLSRSVKRDFDKPADVQNRRSQIILSTDYLLNPLDKNLTLSKSHPVLTEFRTDSTKNATNSLKISKPKRLKNADKKKWNCIVS